VGGHEGQRSKVVQEVGAHRGQQVLEVGEVSQDEQNSFRVILTVLILNLKFLCCLHEFISAKGIQKQHLSEHGTSFEAFVDMLTVRVLQEVQGGGRRTGKIRNSTPLRSRPCWT